MSLFTTLAAVRERMVRRLEAASLDGDSRRAMATALEELDGMWEELQGQAALLADENDRYAQFFEFAPDAYLVTDSSGNIREANQSALELLRAARASVVGRPVIEFVSSGDRTAFLTPATGEPFAVELTVRTIPLEKDGVEGLCWLVRASPPAAS